MPSRPQHIDYGAVPEFTPYATRGTTNCTTIRHSRIQPMMYTCQSWLIDSAWVDTHTANHTLQPRTVNKHLLPIIHKRQSLVIATLNSDVCQDSNVADMKVAPPVTSKAAVVISGSFGDCFAQSGNTTAVQMQRKCIISQTNVVIPSATTTTEHEMVDTITLECGQLLDNCSMKTTTTWRMRPHNVTPPQLTLNWPQGTPLPLHPT